MAYFKWISIYVNPMFAFNGHFSINFKYIFHGFKPMPRNISIFYESTEENGLRTINKGNGCIVGFDGYFFSPVDLTTFDANDVNWQILKSSRHSDFQWYPISMQIIKQQKMRIFFLMRPRAITVQYTIYMVWSRPANEYVCVNNNLRSDALNHHPFTFTLVTMMCDDATRVCQCDSILFI